MFFGNGSLKKLNPTCEQLSVCLQAVPAASRWSLSQLDTLSCVRRVLAVSLHPSLLCTNSNKEVCCSLDLMGFCCFHHTSVTPHQHRVTSDTTHHKVQTGLYKGFLRALNQGPHRYRPPRISILVYCVLRNDFLFPTSYAHITGMSFGLLNSKQLRSFWFSLQIFPVLKCSNDFFQAILIR